MADEPATLNLRILSPSDEVEGGVTFAELPTSTTVKQLRERIQDAVPSRPAPERMRLIYRGRVVANDGDTLGDVFGAGNIRDMKDQSLHLVLRELPATASTPAPRTATAPPNPFRPPPAASPPLQTNPFRTLPQPRPASQPPLPQPHHHHAHPHVHHHHHLPGPVNAFTIPALPQMQQHIAQAMAQNGHPMPPLPTPGPGSPPQMPPNAPPAFPSSGRTVRQEGVGPNGERWSVTYNSTANMPMLPQHPLLARPFAPPPPRPTGAPTPSGGGVMSPLRAQLQAARQELDNVRVLLQSPSGVAGQTESGSSPGMPVWRNDRLLQHLQNTERLLVPVERGLALFIGNPTMAPHADVLALRQLLNELRSEADVLSSMAGRQQESSQPTATQTSSSGSVDASASSTANTTAAPPSSSSQMQNTTPDMPSDAAPELFILSSPQGPVGVLFNQQGTYTTAPMASTMSFQSFTDQFNRNRLLIAGLGQQMASSSSQSHNHLASRQHTPTQQPTTGEAAQQPSNQPQPAQNQQQDQNVNQNANQNANQVNVVNQNRNQNVVEIDENANAQGNIAAHLWLLFKLGCFVYIFAGGGSWYRPIMLGIVAAIVYFVQLGIFEEQVNMVRQHFEAMLPAGALAERVARGRANPPPQRVEPARNVTPHEAAQRLLRQQREQPINWARDSLRAVERSVTLFLASLWPGLGERIIRAEEERVRAEREAEEERVRLEEEARTREADAKKSESEAKEKDEGDVAGPSSNAKGKERAVVDEDEALDNAQALD
ncbi:hypothetical protein P153DRAFT_360960 [Dothidotthia symphoricarpi CBS 119687]|uniref:Ubiquitin-like domain-containing protein n=1 Tax=Dothidotthia symphoricarpi CBS 119687 TaxID=1392245 RepID=A0A6A6A0V8_9PLEO|nr:uncharacterized protein P153DRAFT_360960 [Dothidotthia symphoricarpi CBS 119687]KAF2124784.1 hypothetical protein P153DRAFT_360960 [Dothidotthia symphoricarpi CBS 119687]